MIQVNYLLRINVENVDSIQRNDKCKERNNSVLHLTGKTFVVSRERSGRTSYTFNKKEINR